MISSEDIVKIASYFNIVAHTPGRIRVRVNPKIKDEANNISLKDIEDLPNKINGILNIKINKIIASVTINYNPKIFEPRLWEDLIAKRNMQEVTNVINSLAKDII